MTSKHQQLEKIIQNCKDKMDLINDAIVVAIMRNPENEQNIRNTYLPRIEHFQKLMDDKVCALLHLYSTFQKNKTHNYLLLNYER